MAKRAHNSDELFELKWNNYSNSITEEIFNIRQNDLLVDLTFCCEGVTIGCHKLLIFACSPVLRKILSQNPSPHPIIYITDIKLSILQALLKYIYQGEVQIAKSDLVAFMKAADSFQIRGLQSKTPIENVAASSSGTEVKKRRKTPFEVGPGTSTAADPLNSMQSDQHESSNLDFSEFENECSFGADGHESVDDRFSGITVQQTMEKLKSFIRSIQNGLDILNEFEANGTLTEERREDLCQAISEFMAKGIIKGGRVGHEMIAEAAIILFPGMFDEDPKSLAESLYNRLGQQTQQRYGAESPEDSYEPFSVKIESSDSEQEILSRFMSRSDETKLVQMKEELQIMANKWKKDFIEGIENVESNSVAMKIRDRGPPKTKVYIGEKGKVVAIVKCNICPKQSRIGYKEKSNGLKSFIKGNYIKHLDSTEIIYIKREESSDSENEATLERIEEDLLNYATKWKSDLLNEIKDIETNFIAQRIRDTSIKTKVYLDQNDKVVTRVKCSICGKYNKISYKERVKGYKSFINSNFMNHYKLHLKKTTLRTKRGYNFFQPMVQIKQENYEDSKDPISTMLVKDSSQFSIVEAATQDKYELAAKYLQMEVDSLETYLMTRRDELQNTARKLVLSVVNNPEFNFVGIQVPCNPGVDLRIDDFGTLNASVITDIVIEIKDEPVDDDDVSYISNSYFEAPQLPEISLTETDSDDKYAKATKLLRVVDVQSYLKQKRSELKHLSFKWMNDVLTNVHLDPQSYEPPGIEVDIDDQGKLFATVNCVFCQRSVRLSYKKYESSEGVKCIFNNNSNFKHFLELAKDIAKGLQYLFNENIVHRDLAARNILVTEDNQAKISDFGLARHCNVNGDYQCTNPGPIPAKWYSPEAIDNKTYTKMSDIWSFGVTMYEIFSYGEAPYQHVKCVEDLINLIKTKPLDKPDKCSVEIYEKLMQPCWKIDPKERPKINQILTTIDELLANFESFNQISTEKPIILPDDYIVKDELQ
uniref:CSON007500 protein n=1 Tax=Culicoides sonorensis TaxID=179676 RepID=A0A336M0E7_CULSO